MVSEIGAQSGKRAITLYETTDAGLDALRRWVQHFPGQEQVVIKHPVILKTWLARGEDPEHIIDTLDRHLEATRARLDEALWSRQRSRELGIIDDPDQRFSFAVLDYAIRGLYAEISNISQLRDEIASGTTPRSRQAGATGEGADPPPGTQERARRWPAGRRCRAVRAPTGSRPRQWPFLGRSTGA